MKKIIALLTILIISSACKTSDEEKDAVEKIVAPIENAVTNDKDEYGCLASAGYVWSKINKECIRVFTGIPLNPIDKPQNDDELLCVFVLFGENGDQAEIFLPKQTTSVVLNRETKKGPWISGEWKLLFSDGYVLEKDGKPVFSGDGEIGKKVIGTDKEQ